MLKCEPFTKQQGRRLAFKTSEAGASDERQIHYLHATQVLRSAKH